MLGGGNILDSINSPREWLAATHELFDVVDFPRKSAGSYLIPYVWHSKKYLIKIPEINTSSFYKKQWNPLVIFLFCTFSIWFRNL